MIINGEELHKYRVCRERKIMITKELRARYHSHSSIDGPFRLPDIVQKQQPTMSVHKNHHVSNLCRYKLSFSFTKGQSYPACVKIYGEPCTMNLLN